MSGARADVLAITRLYHAWVTGLVLMVVTRRGGDAAAELIFRLFRRQHREKFLEGVEKLGLRGLPPAVLAAQYHYLSNLIGGVRVAYARESDSKAWIRYPPPRWMWAGTAICAIPSAVSRAMLRGWHAENGISLGVPSLGFVCTKQTVDGQDALEGYFLEHGRPLRPEERLRFAPGEVPPQGLFAAAVAPSLDATVWTADRLEKARRNYAMEYVRSILPELFAQFGPAEARFLAGRSAYLVGLQFCDELKAAVGIEGEGAAAFAEFFRRLAAAQGDHAQVEGDAIVQRGWRLMPFEPMHFAAWNGLWEGLIAAHAPELAWHVEEADADGSFRWRIV